MNLVACGHQDPIGKKYMMSFPSITSQENDSVYTYHYLRERDKAIQNFAGITAQERWMGAWTQYSNYPATGWCNLGINEYFSSNYGWLYQTRRTFTNTDYADEGMAITATIVLRAMDFENAGIRKQVRHVIGHYRLITSLTNITISAAIDLSNNFIALDNFSLVKSGSSTTISPVGLQKIVSVTHSLSSERGLYFQIQIVDAGYREAIDFTGLDYLVLPLSHHGILEASQTSKSSF